MQKTTGGQANLRWPEFGVRFLKIVIAKHVTHTRGYLFTLLPFGVRLRRLNRSRNKRLRNRRSHIRNRRSCTRGARRLWRRNWRGRDNESVKLVFADQGHHVPVDMLRVDLRVGAVADGIDDSDGTGIDEGRHSTTERVRAGAMTRVIQADLQGQLHVSTPPTRAENFHLCLQYLFLVIHFARAGTRRTA